MIGASDDLNRRESAEDLVASAHGGLKMEGSNVLPALLHEGNQEVNGHSDVLSEVFF